jgi:hypothetical protein
MGRGAVSRYKLFRSQEAVKVQNFHWLQLLESGYRLQQDLSWEQSTTKTMTDICTLLSVLAFRANFKIVLVEKTF